MSAEFNPLDGHTVPIMPRPNPTDLGNAERFVRQHGQDVRWCDAWGWLAWDGKRWARDLAGEVHRLATTTVRAMYGEAEKIDNPKDRDALVRHAMHSEAERRIAAMLELAKHLKPVATVPEAFDGPATAYLLNVLNGTLDLKTGELLPHQREHHITKLAPTAFDEEGRSPLWEGFLERMVPDPDVRSFLQRAVGYTLTGNTGEEVLFFILGPAAAGKSTATEAAKATLGEYACTTDFETFLRKRSDAGVRHDIARLAGARMVLSLEVDEGRHLAEALVKNLTGGDTVAARHLYRGFFEYRPAFKLWLVANHRPQANADNGALWRRILLVPFEEALRPEDRDPAVKQTLTSDVGVRAAILAWAVRGCLQWQRIGLAPPKAVRRATDAYRESCDHVADFLADCFPEPPESVTAGELREKYETWCKANGEKPVPARFLAEALKRRRLVPGKDRGARVWRWPQEAIL